MSLWFVVSAIRPKLWRDTAPKKIHVFGPEYHGTSPLPTFILEPGLSQAVSLPTSVGQGECHLLQRRKT